MKVVPLTKSKTYPKYRMLYSEIENIFLNADISVVEAVGMLEMLKHTIMSYGNEESGDINDEIKND